MTQAIREVLRSWGTGPGTLVVSGGAQGADIMAAEQALLLGAEVWLLVALPDDEFIPGSVRLPGSDWEERYRKLRARCPTRFQADELGPAASDEEAFERNNDWLLDAAQAAAPAAGLGRVGRRPGRWTRWDLGLRQRARTMGAAVAIIDPARPRHRRSDPMAYDAFMSAATPPTACWPRRSNTASSASPGPGTDCGRWLCSGTSPTSP